MCTLTFIPYLNGSVIITSNRDEDPSRPTSSNLQLKQHKNLEALLPVDQIAGGSWIACAQNGQIHCLLNGAFEQHKYDPPYQKSRGIVLLDSLHYASLQRFRTNYNFEGIQPFTLVGLNMVKHTLEEVRYTGKYTTCKKINPSKSHIWSAAQLYAPDAIRFRESLFQEFTQHSPEPSPDELLNFHKQSNLTDPDKGFVINRDEKVKTVSITQVLGSDQILKMKYTDLEAKAQNSAELNFNSQY